MNQKQTTTSPETEQKASVSQTDADSVFVSFEDAEKQKNTDTNANGETTAEQDPAQDTLKISDTEDSMIVSFPALSDEKDNTASILYQAKSAYPVWEDAPGKMSPVLSDEDKSDDDADDALTDNGETVPDDVSTSDVDDTVVQDAVQPKKKIRRWPWITAGSILFVILCYLFVLFVPSGPIANLRDLYIQTAMSTADHQWLATIPFPQWAIDRAWTDPNVKPDDPPHYNDPFLETVGTDTEAVTSTDVPPTQTPDVTTDPTEVETSEGKTDTPPQMPDILGLNSLKVGGKDYAGNKVIEVNKEEGLFISEFSGNSQMIPLGKYHGYVMLIDDPSRIFVASTPEPGVTGYRILDMMDHYGDVVAGINASGFSDPNDAGTGGDIIGGCLSEGKFWGYYTEEMESVVLTKENRLLVGWLPNWTKYTNMRDGIQFGPALVRDGKNLINASNYGGMGCHPRAAIGQREDGAIILIVIDGRKITNVGCTLWEMADMMLKYGAVTAGGCDGGSSVVMAYGGEVINENSSANPEFGRRIPNAFLVRSKKSGK